MDGTALCDIGFAGLGVMGRNLALQAAGKGFAIAAYDPWAEARAAWQALAPEFGPADNEPGRFAARLRRPRRILALFKAGEPTDGFLSALLPHLDPGDVVADLGNAHYLDTQSRQSRFAEAGVHLLGVGISGGSEGARTGASFMAGGSREGWAHLDPILADLAARAEGVPCRAHFGPGGAGHFVKMVHNGIEYAEMQALAECYMVLRDACGLSAAEIAEHVDAWNQGLGESFLTGLTADILRTPDPWADDPGGGALIDRISDVTGQKGTGRWTIEAALELGVPVPTIAEAVFARALSSRARERRIAAGILGGPTGTMADPSLAVSLGEGLLATRLSAFAQGFSLLAAASQAYGWAIDPAAVAEVWRAGCILRGALLPIIAQAYRADICPVDLLAAPDIAAWLDRAHRSWRQAIATAQAAGIPVPALSSALAAYDGWRSNRLGSNLIAAQRDAFGAHGFQRIDHPGVFHARWQRGIGAGT